MEVTANVIKATVHLEPFSGDGQTAAKTWLQWFERYCALYKEPEGQNLLTFSFYLSSHARIWFESLTEEIKTDYPRLMPLNPQTFEETRQKANLAEKTLLAITLPVAAYLPSNKIVDVRIEELNQRIRSFKCLSKTGK